MNRLLFLGVTLLSGCLSNDIFWCSSRQNILNRFGSDVRAAQMILRNADAIESPSLGPAGSPSCLVAAYRVLLQDKNAPQHFMDLSRDATLPGRLYALAGLYEVDPAAAKILAASLRELEFTQIQLREGCTVSVATPPAIVARLEADDFRASWRWRP